MRYPIKGGTVCATHGGKAKQVRAAAAVNVAVLRWQDSDSKVHPGETLLRAVGVTARRAELYAALLDEQYALAEAGHTDVELPRGVGALIGWKYDLSKDGIAVPVEEATRGLVALEAAERGRLVKYAKAAIDAGVSERLVRLEEQKGTMIIEVLKRMLDLAEKAGLGPDQRRLVWAQAPAALRAVDGGAA